MRAFLRREMRPMLVTGVVVGLALSVSAARSAPWRLASGSIGDDCPIAQFDDESGLRPASGTESMEWKAANLKDESGTRWLEIDLVSEDPPFFVALYSLGAGGAVFVDTSAPDAEEAELNEWPFAREGLSETRIVFLKGRFFLIEVMSNSRGADNDPELNVSAYRILGKTFDLACRFEPTQK